MPDFAKRATRTILGSCKKKSLDKTATAVRYAEPVQPSQYRRGRAKVRLSQCNEPLHSSISRVDNALNEAVSDLRESDPRRDWTQNYNP